MPSTALSSTRAQFTARVVANRLLCREHYRLTLALAAFPPTRPGQFIQIECRDFQEATDHETVWDFRNPPRFSGCDLGAPTALLRRPFSLAGRSDGSGGVELDIIHRVVGVGTDWMSRLKPGDPVRIIGPLGNSFALPADNQVGLLVGGGVGIPPMLYLAAQLSGRPAIAFSGATTRELLPLTLDRTPRDGEDAAEPAMRVAEFAAYAIPTVITTDDRSYGFGGFVTQALEQYLDRHAGELNPVIYTCGPEAMMKRVADIAGRRGIECQIAVERAMACGMGTCQSCVIKVKAAGRADRRDWIFRLACTDGPVFRGTDLLW